MEQKSGYFVKRDVQSSFYKGFEKFVDFKAGKEKHVES